MTQLHKEISFSDLRHLDAPATPTPDTIVFEMAWYARSFLIIVAMLVFAGFFLLGANAATRFFFSMGWGL